MNLLKFMGGNYLGEYEHPGLYQPQLYLTAQYCANIFPEHNADQHTVFDIRHP